MKRIGSAMRKVRAPRSPKARESELEKALSSMQKGLSFGLKSAILSGGAGRAVAVNSAATKLLEKYSDEKMDRLMKKVLDKVDRRSASQLSAALGINTVELAKDKVLEHKIGELKSSATDWVKKLRNDTLEYYTSNTLEALESGESLESVMAKFDGLVETRKNHAKSVAHDQIANFNSMSTNLRAQALGVEEGIWRTSGDGNRVRPSHRDRNGKKFKLSEGLYSKLDGLWLLPGVDFGCRCTYEMIIPS